MWFEKRLIKVKLYLINKIKDDENAVVKRKAYIECLNPKIINSIDVVNLCSFEFESIYNNIDKYNDKMQWLNSCFDSNSLVPNTWYNGTVETVNLFSFFIDDKENQINKIKSIIKFKELSVLFFEKYHSLKKFEYGNECHNFRVLRRFEINLIQVIDSLLRASHER